ncbi:MAG: methyltransferase family protein [Promethearchaeota archaeon]
MSLNEFIGWLNIAVLFVSMGIFLFLGIKSIQPAAMEQKIGEIAYEKAARYRMLATIPYIIMLINYIVYFFYPLPIPFLPRYFPWYWWVSIVIGIIIAIPSGYLMFRGIKDAGEETMRPKKEHTLYGGIYEKMRHPQTVGELSLWCTFAFFLNSPFLVLLSLIWIPLGYIICKMEERDLVIRYGEPYKEYLKNTPFIVSMRKKRTNTAK